MVLKLLEKVAGLIVTEHTGANINDLQLHFYSIISLSTECSWLN